MHSLVFSPPRLGFARDCKFKSDAANRSLIPCRQTRLAGGIPWGSQSHCKFSFVPKPGRRPNVDIATATPAPHKRQASLVRKGNASSCDSQFFKMHVAPHQKVGMGKVVYHTMLVGGGRRGEARQTLKHDRAIPKMTAVV